MIPCTDDRRVSLYFTMGRRFPSQNCPFLWGIWTPSNIRFPGPTRVLNPNGISIGSAVFTGLTSVTDRPTDHATQSVTIDHIYVHSTHYSLGGEGTARNRGGAGPNASPVATCLKTIRSMSVVNSNYTALWYVTCRISSSDLLDPCRWRF